MKVPHWSSSWTTTSHGQSLLLKWGKNLRRKEHPKQNAITDHNTRSSHSCTAQGWKKVVGGLRLTLGKKGWGEEKVTFLCFCCCCCCCFFYHYPNLFLIDNKLNHSSPSWICFEMVIGEWSPCLYVSHQIFSITFASSVILRRRSLVRTCQSAKANTPEEFKTVFIHCKNGARRCVLWQRY